MLVLFHSRFIDILFITRLIIFMYSDNSTSPWTIKTDLECVRDSDEHFVIGLESPENCGSEVQSLLPLPLDEASSTCIPASSVGESSDLSSRCSADNLVQSTALFVAGGELRAALGTAISDASDAAVGMCV